MQKKKFNLTWMPVLIANSLSREILCRLCFSMTSSKFSLNIKWKQIHFCCTSANCPTCKDTPTSQLRICNSLLPRPLSCPTACWTSAWPTRCPQSSSPGCCDWGAGGSCDERAAHWSCCRTNRSRRRSASSWGSDWPPRKNQQVSRPGRKHSYCKINQKKISFNMCLYWCTCR